MQKRLRIISELCREAGFFQPFKYCRRKISRTLSLQSEIFCVGEQEIPENKMAGVAGLEPVKNPIFIRLKVIRPPK
jgi:hypothetical protein